MSMKNYAHNIIKYNKPIPRYTSYPAVPYWQGAPDIDKWGNHLKAKYDDKKGVDLYLHVPFCEKLCYYCGCNRTITKNHDIEVEYVSLILKEWDLYRELLGFTPKINSLHLGGGTPNFLSAASMNTLLSKLLSSKSAHFVGSIEIDPRTYKASQGKILSEFGFRKVSLGIQDFDSTVQAAINRIQTFELVSEVIDHLRSCGFESINFDLIYGLPKQTLLSVCETIDKVKILAPDLIAFYSYAHLPDRLKNQKLINAKDLPDSILKRSLYETGKSLFEEAGFVEIGMDHFARPNTSLEKAMQAKRLQRNFMGYVELKSNILIGLGPTSISDSSLSFVQNKKNYNEYKNDIQAGKLNFITGHLHDDVDLLVQEIIQNLMCNRQISLSTLEKLPFYNAIKKELDDLKEDNIIIYEDNKLQIPKASMAFVRNVAHVFDVHARRNEVAIKFSNSI